MNNKRCYGRKKYIVPKEKSFIRNFFDGNQSSDFSLIESRSNEKNQQNNCSKNERTILGEVINSPVLFHEEFPSESSSEEQKSPGLKNIKVAKKKKYGKKKTYQKKTYKGIQHFSTKYCKSLQPRWAEFEQHNFIIERHGRANHVAKKNSKNVGKLSNCNPSAENLDESSFITKRTKGNLQNNVSIKNRITSKIIGTMKSKRCVYSDDAIDSSGELFAPLFKQKKNVLKKKSLIKMPLNSHSLIKKQDDPNSKCTMVEKVIQCEESGSMVKSNNTADILFKNILPEQVKPSHEPKSSVQIPNNDSQVNEIFPCVSGGISKNHKDSDSIVVSLIIADNNHNSHELFIDSNSKYIENSFNNSQNIPSSKVKHPELEDHVSKHTAINSSDNGNCSLLDVQRPTVENSILENNIIQVYKCNLGKQSVEKCKSLISIGDVSHKSECKIMPLEQKSNSCSFKKSENFSPKHNILLSSFKKDKDLNSVAFSPNVSDIMLCCDSVGKKIKGSFATSTPVLSRKAYNSEKIKNLSLPKSENTSALEKDNLFNISQKLLYFQNSLQLNMSPNLITKKSIIPENSRKSSSNPHKNTSVQKNRSILDVSSRNALLAEENQDFTKTNLLKLCDQDTIVAFADVYKWNNLKVKKIGEGTYGEVFMITKRKTSSVLKVIPVTEDPTNKTLQGLVSAYSEVKITKCLSSLRNNKKNQTKHFIKLIRSSLVSGLYPHSLIKAWDKFSEVETTYNDRPDIFDGNQLFVILELEYGGTDMSSFVIKNAVEAESILQQIAVSLAVAEDEFAFEHRDLHLGNILVKRNRSKTASYKLRGKDIAFPCHGLQVTIIDFTLSLLYENGYTYYFDLAEDVSLFEQTGDYQFDVYRSMKKYLQNKWEDCSLYSNVLWLKYLCKKMKEYKYSCALTASQKKRFDNLYKKLAICNCAMECLNKWQITTTQFSKNSESMSQARRSILVSRNSIQKSKLSICN